MRNLEGIENESENFVTLGDEMNMDGFKMKMKTPSWIDVAPCLL